jgi:hypothetical protein
MSLIFNDGEWWRLGPKISRSRGSNCQQRCFRRCLKQRLYLIREIHSVGPVVSTATSRFFTMVNLAVEGVLFSRHIWLLHKLYAKLRHDKFPCNHATVFVWYFKARSVITQKRWWTFSVEMLSGSGASVICCPCGQAYDESFFILSNSSSTFGHGKAF